MNGRIFFKDSPYPNGHKIKEFNWSARLHPIHGIYFDFHLETESYYAEDDSEDPEDFEPESDWKAKIVWGNYHACRISSNFWNYGGVLVGTEMNKIDFNKIELLNLQADILPRPEEYDFDNPPFGIYLLGHDDCAGHHIQIKKNNNATFDIQWEGQIALVYSGDDEFRYQFSAQINDVELDAIYYPEEFPESELQTTLSKFAVNYENIKVIRSEGTWVYE